jgi:DnaJ-class molecular chaperone
MMNCPNCRGYGKSQGFYVTPDRTELPCPICNGTGKLPADIIYDPARGQKLKAERVDKEITLRQYCKDLGLDAQERAEQERGFFRP